MIIPIIDKHGILTVKGESHTPIAVNTYRIVPGEVSVLDSA